MSDPVMESLEILGTQEFLSILKVFEGDEGHKEDEGGKVDKGDKVDEEDNVDEGDKGGEGGFLLVLVFVFVK